MALIAAHLNAGHCGGDSVAIGIYSPSSPTSIPPSPPPLSPSLISLSLSTMFASRKESRQTLAGYGERLVNVYSQVYNRGFEDDIATPDVYRIKSIRFLKLFFLSSLD